MHLSPTLGAGVDVRALRLSGDEALLWSRIDGRTTLSQLADLTGRPAAAVFALLAGLAERGAIVWPDSAALRPLEAGDGAGPPRTPAHLAAHPALHEACDLTFDERLRILTTETFLGTRPPWELLGVAQEASPADVKRAYFEASKVFHPDRYFGKKLGSFAARLERIFQALKQARDALLDPAGRAASPRGAEAPAAAPAAPKRAGGWQVSHAERAARQALQVQDLTQARIWAERAVQLAPQAVKLRILAADVCEGLDEKEAARKHLQVAASLDKDDLDVKTRLARLLHGKSHRH